MLSPSRRWAWGEQKPGEEGTVGRVASCFQAALYLKVKVKGSASRPAGKRSQPADEPQVSLQLHSEKLQKPCFPPLLRRPGLWPHHLFTFIRRRGCPNIATNLG